LWLLAGCASKEPPALDSDATLPFPEVKEITFQGNHALRSRELRKVMATTPRPVFPP
jgi:hypothetical protein